MWHDTSMAQSETKPMWCQTVHRNSDTGRQLECWGATIGDTPQVVDAPSLIGYVSLFYILHHITSYYFMFVLSVSVGSNLFILPQFLFGVIIQENIHLIHISWRFGGFGEDFIRISIHPPVKPWVFWGLGLGRSARGPRGPRLAKWSEEVGRWGGDGNGKLPAFSKFWEMGMDQYLLIPFLVGWTSIYQLFWCSPGVQGFDPSPDDWMTSMEMCGEFFFLHFWSFLYKYHQITSKYIHVYLLYIYICTYVHIRIYIYTPVYSNEMTCIVFIFAIMISETGLDPGIPLHLKGNVIVRTFQVNSEKSALLVLVMYATTYPLYFSGWWFQTFFIFHNI